MKNQIVEATNVLALQKQIAETKEKIASLEKEVIQSRIEKAKNLPSYFEVSNMSEVLEILKSNNVIPNMSYSSKQGKKIPEQIRNKVKSMIKVGHFTGKQIAQSLSISLPSVQNIKKQLGLTRTYSS